MVRHGKPEAAGELDPPFSSPSLKRKLKANEANLDQITAEIRNEEYETALDSEHNACVITDLKQEVRRSSKKLKAVQATMEGMDFDYVALKNQVGKSASGDVLPSIQNQLSGLDTRMLAVEDLSVDAALVGWIINIKTKFGANFEKFIVKLSSSLMTNKLNASVSPITQWLLSQTNIPLSKSVSPNFGDKLKY